MRKPLTKSQLREIEALIQKPDSEIDYSDIPEAVGDLYKPIKRPISLRLDADVLEWLKSKPGYQTRINQLLREAMLGQNRKNPRLS
jgi:uncharacterized protein (DUF4415 family)